MNSYHKTRCKFHDYRSKCIYLITLTKEPGVEEFSILFGSKEKGFRDAGVRYMPLGRLIKDTLRTIPEAFPGTRVNQYIVMPDHLHFIIEVLEDGRYHLGDIISRFTRDCNVAASKYDRIFEHGYHDRILRRKGQLNNMRDYIRDNPRRRLIKANMPSYFKSPQLLTILGHDYMIFGNFFLLKNPEKVAVRISSKFTAEELEAKTSEYRETIRCGGVLISPFISEKEKVYRDEAMESGANLVVLDRIPMDEFFKPARQFIRLWNEGRLLIISTYKSSQPEKLTRTEALAMNELAQKIADTPLTDLLLRPLYKRS